MKIDNAKISPGYMDMTIAELAYIIFDKNGDTKASPVKARKALIIKLEEHYKVSGFGNPETGELNEMDAYMGCAMILSDCHPTTRKPSTG